MAVIVCLVDGVRYTDNDIRRFRDENKRLNRFVKECGPTLVPCPKCGCRMLANDEQCVLCELTEVRQELDHYKRLATQRGARMQKMWAWMTYNPLTKSDGSEFLDWFDEDGVPVDD